MLLTYISALGEFPKGVVCAAILSLTFELEEECMPTSRGRTQDRRLVAGGQDHEVRYEAKKVGVKPSAVKKAVGKAGNSRKRVEAQLKG